MPCKRLVRLSGTSQLLLRSHTDFHNLKSCLALYFTPRTQEAMIKHGTAEDALASCTLGSYLASNRRTQPLCGQHQGQSQSAQHPRCSGPLPSCCQHQSAYTYAELRRGSAGQLHTVASSSQTGLLCGLSLALCSDSCWVCQAKHTWPKTKLSGRKIWP